ncbi:hypothetical protein OV208_04080 [Corallococcus sp. bb12-1]|uniref:hypothetical protein n=1 Tax=Corallococcus sp. bb12-1 TaxID=2996784 RepID=UPI0022700B08|nr:hypothetical protein [Corallococcus sp. bb12-1]MCY1040491.1 hypothetical protein [Corallococcus sp. bb12-1]
MRLPAGVVARSWYRMPPVLGLSWVFGLWACASEGAFDGDVVAEPVGQSDRFLGDDTPGERAGLGFTSEGLLERAGPVGDERARRAEADRVVRELWAVAGERGVPGEAWTFDYQSHGGALTLLSFRRTAVGRESGASGDWNGFARELTRSLSTLVGTKSRRLRFTLERGPERWRFSLEAVSGRMAEQARTVPESLPGMAQPLLSDALAVTRQLLPVPGVPREGRVRQQARLHFEGMRLLQEGEPGVFEVQEGLGRQEVPASGDSRMPLVQAVLPFGHAVGRRTVEVELEGRHVRGEAGARWRVVAAKTLEPPAPPEAMEDIAKEYRAMHEDILRHWRQEVRDDVRLAGAWSFEQLAYWYVGGFIARGTLGMFEAVAPTVVAVLGRGGAKAAQWFRTVLIRTPPGEREALERIWMKAEAEGVAALGAGEKAELQRILSLLEDSLHQPLDRQAKKRLRQWARREYFETVNPRLARELGPLRMENYEIHHRIPLEYSRLFPRMDINQGANLIAVERTVHRSINRIWESVGPHAQRLNSKQVEELTRTIDQHYGSWFHRVHVPAESASRLVTAEQNALRAVKTLLER